MRLSFPTCTFGSVIVVVVVVIVSHIIQQIGCQPKKTAFHGGQSRPSWSDEHGKNNNKKYGSAPPPARAVRSEKAKIKVT